MNTSAPVKTIKPSIAKFLHLSLEQVECCLGYGLISAADFAGYKAVWAWSSAKFGGSIADRHEAFWNQFGQDAYYRRINKVRAACGFALIEPC